MLYTRVDIFYKNNKWYCQDEVKHGIIYYSKVYYSEQKFYFFTKYKNELKKLFSKESFTVMSLLASQTDITFNQIQDAKKHYQKDNLELLDILLLQDRPDILQAYPKALLSNYKNNAYKNILAKYPSKENIQTVKLLKELNLNMYHYSDDIFDYTKEPKNDNLYLAIRHNYNDASMVLLDKINTSNNFKAYIYYAIDNHNYTMFKYIFQRYPHKQYSKKEISTYIMYASKANSLEMIEFLVQTFPYDKYDDIVDKETGLTALGLAKNTNAGEKRVAYLKKHNFSSNFFNDITNSTSRFFSDVGEFIYSIVLVIALAFGANY